MSGVRARVCFGEVGHARRRPFAHRFRYPVFFLGFDPESAQALRHPLFGVNRRGLLSYHDADHGRRDGTPAAAWAREVLARHGLAQADGELWLQTFPRVLGYVFNPVSFWYCHDRDGRLRAVLAEVNNTFGESHTYLVAHADRRPIRPGDTLGAGKVFHVSPFFDVDGHYRFRFLRRNGRIVVRIDYADADGPLLDTWVSGREQPFSTGTLARALVRYPWMTATVIARIHWQALRLWLRGARFFRKPHPPVEEVTQ
ncbi:MAG TPA: DUF1365 domain-containing protein [Pelomicrobium sp.]|nr:DUF1365 domain-containing protein [Pelomicrobium sp.]